jgi:hypothetical protein
MASVWLVVDGGRDAVRRPRLGFLGTSRSAAEPPTIRVGIPLDFLGFSRPNLDLSVDYTRLSVDDSSSRFCCRKRTVEAAAPRFDMRRGRIVHGASSLHCLIFRNRMPPGPLPFARLYPKANLGGKSLGSPNECGQRSRGKVCDNPTPQRAAPPRFHFAAYRRPTAGRHSPLAKLDLRPLIKNPP